MKNILLLSGKKVYITSTQAPPPDFVGSPLPEGASWSGRLPAKPKFERIHHDVKLNIYFYHLPP